MPKPKIRPDIAPDTQTDGRRQRSDVNRRRIAEAMIDLVFDGETAPSAERVAERAGVGRRTVFRLFSDMDGVYREAHALMVARVRPILEDPITGATWRAKLDQMIERRARLFEEVLPIMAVTDALRGPSEFLEQDHQNVARMLRSVLLFVVPKTVSEDRTLFEAIDVSLSFEAWRRLRQEQHLSAKVAVAVMKRMVAALLD